ncbi:Unknown protein, partial [Striga hermonthica]
IIRLIFLVIRPGVESLDSTPVKNIHNSSEAVVPVELGEPTYRIQHFTEEANSENMKANLDLLEEHRTRSELKNVAYKQINERYINSKLKPRAFRVGDLVLKRIMGPDPGPLRPRWERPFQIIKILPHGAYQIAHPDGTPHQYPWNA